MKKTLAIIVSILALLAPVATRATTVERLNLDQLVQKSNRIVVGKVRNTRTYWSNNGKIILTSYTLDVQEMVKGQPQTSLEVTTIGGTIDGVTLHVAGMPSFENGENAVVFVENSGAFSTVVGLSQGKFSVENGRVANTVTDLTFPDGKGGQPVQMPVDAFLRQIKLRLER